LTPAEPPPRGAPPPHVVILAGGIGSRFWPASTPTRPKQLLPLASERPLVADALERARAITGDDRIHVLAGASLVAALRAGLPPLPEASFWKEPRARGTGPVLAWAAYRIHREDPDGVMVSLHADHRIEPLEAFSDLLRGGVQAASASGLLLTVGIPPDRPETGFGWIRPGDPVEAPPGVSCRRVGAFVEKPDRPTAERYLAQGLLWNSGIFIWPVARFLEEIRRHSPEIAPHLALLDRGDDDAFFEAVTPISVDEAVLERSGHVGVLAATFQWDDVGSWDALARSRPADDQGNVGEGRMVAVEASRNVVWSDEGPVVLFGVDDLVVVRAGGVTVVAPRNRSADWKTLLRHLPEDLADPGGAG
jgi:mannose-1-phosphate guanylyltransferase